jgi:hypothetical protein
MNMKLKITFAVTAGLTFTATSASAITIINPSFESGNTGWTQVSGGIKTPPEDSLGDAPEGSKVYFTWSNGQHISQILADTLQANTTYTLQMDYLTRTDGEGPITAFLALGYGAGGPGGGTELESIVNNNPGAPVPATGSGSFTTWTLTYTTGASPTGEDEVLWIDLGANPNLNNGSAGYDNIRLVAVTVPEPSTTALLGLGGLALILRRRK